MTSKYERLTRYLEALPENKRELTLSFRELESILGSVLPKSASNHRAWWANQADVKNRPQARSWSEAGFEVNAVHQTLPMWVRLRRK